jgi:uncharacterized protein YndB with AHSA1/START domain
MADLTLTRHLEAEPERVFDYISKVEHLLKWWGPETTEVAEHDLGFQKTGPWMSVMVNKSGDRFKCSGQVTNVDRPRSIGFTWAWHDENDARGVESHVTIRLVPAQGGGTTLELNHVDLPDESVAENHSEGWGSALNRLERLAREIPTEEK